MNHPNQRGQGSIELLLVIISVLGLTFFFSVSYLSSQDVTTALVIAKNRVTEKLNLHEIPAIIENIRYNKNGPDAITIKVITKPSDANLSPAELQAIQTEITNSTPFSIVTIQMNPTA